MLYLNNICKSYDGKIIFKDISCSVFQGERIGLIGNNGVGKTTLIKILLGIEDKDKGTINGLDKLRISYMPQEIDYSNTEMAQTISDIRKNISSVNDSITFIKNIKLLINSFESNKKTMAMSTKDLSGGEKTKLYLLKTLTTNADIFILDEPTNHLDIETIEILKKIINSSTKTYIFISHDRDFMNSVVKKVFELTKHKLNEYTGTYDDFKMQKEHENLTKSNIYNKQKREIAHIESIIDQKKRNYAIAHKEAGQHDFYRSKAKKHVNVMKNAQKRLEKIKRNRVEKPEDDPSLAFDRLNHFIGNTSLPKIVIRIENMSKSFGDKEVLKDININIERNVKVALIGENGSGKSTILKLLVDELKPTNGNIKKSPSVSIGYFSQELDLLNQDNNIYEEVRVHDMEQGEIRKVLACFLFKRDKVFTKIKDLSMGEKCRVAFVKLLLKKNNVLVLDEITNYMDIISKECLERALHQYKGTILFVSHDLYFIKRIANKIVEIKDKQINKFDGSYDEYVNYKTENNKNDKKHEYKNLKAELATLQIKRSFIQGKLCFENSNDEDKELLENEFKDISDKINEINSLLK
ncbi:ABC-F family ATP-binding cassette domain-containing protein [Clostridiaceae bacterium M8S5]|nr:ABC-F family ATP-binding cassette domain-containing protein [Clostridiaceae bacterium M8S5]